MPKDKHHDWRKKDRERFADAALVAVRMEIGGPEVWLYHERICDRIDAAGRNGTKVSLYQLAREVHDDPYAAPGTSDHDAWVIARTRILTRLRELGKLVFEGDIELHNEVVISLPEDTYQRWHRATRQGTNGKDAPRGAGGRFARETPAHTGTNRNETSGTGTAAPGAFPSPEPTGTVPERPFRSARSKQPAEIASETPAHTGTNRDSRETETVKSEEKGLDLGKKSSSSAFAHAAPPTHEAPPRTVNLLPSLNPARRPEEEGEKVSIDQIDAATVGTEVAQLTTILASVVVDEGQAAYLAEQIRNRARAVHPRIRRRLPFEAWQRAAVAFVERIKDGHTVDDPTGYIIGMAPNFEHDTTPVELKHFAPKVRDEAEYKGETEDDLWSRIPSHDDAVGGAA